MERNNGTTKSPSTPQPDLERKRKREEKREGKRERGIERERVRKGERVC